MTYKEFLQSKTAVAIARGSDSSSMMLAPHLKPHQVDICRWAIQGGNRAIFASFGLGKTHIQIQILKAILENEPGCGLIVCPLGVRGEFLRDGLEFFGVEFTYVRTNEEFEELSASGQRFFITNYERVRDGNLDPNLFTVVSLDEASILRGFGTKTYQTFLTLFDDVKYKYVATATPDPNRTKELIHYAGFLGIMDTGQALTRFFKRDSTQAGNLNLYPHKEQEFWSWVQSWAVFLDKPSDLGYSDDGYTLPPIKIIQHRIPVDHGTAGFDSWGQGKLLRDSAISLRDAAREKRDSLQDRVATAKAIIEAGAPEDHWIIWHDLEDERRGIEKAIPECVTIWGSQDLETREDRVAEFSDGKIRIFGTKPVLSGSGCNFQRHCHKAIFMGIGWKFNDFIQACHRLYRFLQTSEVEIHLIYTESEDNVYEVLMRKWKQHDAQREIMAALLRRYGLNTIGLTNSQITRSTGVTRQEVRGERYVLANNDNVFEMENIPDGSVDLIITSWPFSDHYEYSESYHDFGHNDGDAGFFEQMDFLTPLTMKALAPGRIYCVHVKDRVVYGSISGDGMYQMNEFSDKCTAHMKRHGFRFCGRITIATDVVRENNQTYRLGWTENSKDGTKMGVGSSEYVLLFRKLPSDTTRSYADTPVAKSKEDYTRARWQFDAHGFWRSSGNKFLTPDQIKELPMETIRACWHDFNKKNVYNFPEHVRIAEDLERHGMLPSSFMVFDPQSTTPWCWDDVVRMRTLNTDQSRKRQTMHVCPLQFDIVERLIERFSMPGELVLDPFSGIGTVPYLAIKMGRRGYGIELNSDYWHDSLGYCRAAEINATSPTLFDLLETEESEVKA